jgi:hypothetical protein
MICSRCKRAYNSDEAAVCPHCGEVSPIGRSGILKTSTILISSGNVDAVYRSVKDVPVLLRKRLLKSTNGLNSATILIADRRGREEIGKAIRNLPSAMQQRLLSSMLKGESTASSLGWLTPLMRRVIAAAIVLGCLVFLGVMFVHRW